MPITTETIETLIELAKQVSQKAYCPYSQFSVGSAILLSNGEIYSGCNVENISYGLSLCAERNAISHAVTQSEEKIELQMVVVYTPTATPTSPCGACRQVILEFANDNTQILCICDSDQQLKIRIEDLLPHAFNRIETSSS